jgi:hypothetical protein
VFDLLEEPSSTGVGKSSDERCYVLFKAICTPLDFESKRTLKPSFSAMFTPTHFLAVSIEIERGG